jgi:hypothetical protein
VLFRNKTIIVSHEGRVQYMQDYVCHKQLVVVLSKSPFDFMGKQTGCHHFTPRRIYNAVNNTAGRW